MELAIPFKLNNEPYNDIAAEFNISYNEEENSAEKLKEFVELYADKRINIETDCQDIEFLNMLNSINNNIALRLMHSDQLEFLSQLRENNIKFFFDRTFISATSIYSLQHILSLGVSDVYIADDLFYNLFFTRKVLDSYEAHLRFIPNVVATTVPISNFNKAPWLPPDAFDLLEQYVDIIEFDCGDPYDWHKFKVYYKAWMEDHFWRGDLREILPLPDFIPDTSLLGRDWLLYKTQCGYKCANKNNPCNKCDQYINIALSLAGKGIMINRKVMQELEQIESSE